MADYRYAVYQVEGIPSISALREFLLDLIELQDDEVLTVDSEPFGYPNMPDTGLIEKSYRVPLGEFCKNQIFDIADSGGTQIGFFPKKVYASHKTRQYVLPFLVRGKWGIDQDAIESIVEQHGYKMQAYIEYFTCADDYEFLPLTTILDLQLCDEY